MLTHPMSIGLTLDKTIWELADPHGIRKKRLQNYIPWNSFPMTFHPDTANLLPKNSSLVFNASMIEQQTRQQNVWINFYFSCSYVKFRNTIRNDKLQICT